MPTERSVVRELLAAALEVALALKAVHLDLVLFAQIVGAELRNQELCGAFWPRRPAPGMRNMSVQPGKKMIYLFIYH